MTPNMVPPGAPAPNTATNDRDAIAAVEGGKSLAVVDETPLIDEELEEGIASIFAALHSATQPADATSDDDESDDTDEELAAADTSTLRLLGELERIWQRAA